MSFKKIDINDNKMMEGRNCAIIYNFNEKELKSIKNFSNILGIKDQIILSDKNGEGIIKDILEDKIITSENGGRKEKAIIFNSIAPAKLNVFIENIKKLRINNPFIATVTETSREWTINDLILNLIAERKAINKGQIINHK